MGDDEQREQTPEERRRALLIVLAIMAATCLFAGLRLWDLFAHGSAADLERASERIRDLNTGPNAP